MSMEEPISSPDYSEAACDQGHLAVINAGSSSIKFAIYGPGRGASVLFKGQVESIGLAPRLKVKDCSDLVVLDRGWQGAELDHESATLRIVETSIELLRGRRVTAVGHRVVHGGAQFTSPVRVTPAVTEALAKLVKLAPLHQPHNLAPIRAIAAAAPQIAQVACFDTAFHRCQDALSQAFALPRRFSEAGIRRYGFHGLSYEFIVSRLPEIAPEMASSRVVIAHLGNGASLCAVRNGRSVATTMGFTAVEGLVMGTRCGSLDPGVVLYLMDEYGMDARAVEDLIYTKSGLLGVSDISSDMRTLRASAAPGAREAIALFVYRIVREIGSLAAALGGLDGVVFTGGIGENDAATRAAVMSGCAWLGLEADRVRNQAGTGRISADGSRVSAWVVRTDEERIVAQHTLRVLCDGNGEPQ